MKNTVLAAAAFAIACAVAGLVFLKRPVAPDMAPPTVMAVRQPEPAPTVDNALPAAPPAEAPPVFVQAPTPAPSSPAARSTPPPAEPAKTPPKAPGAALQGAKPGKEPPKDPMAREALALVGVDPGAEEYWYAAINDPALSAHERQDLIEDLNEDGLSDPKHPGPKDLPVILRRIQLIEAGGPYAMDTVNADAFQEAYKDLVNLANLVLGGGEPVR